MNIGPLNTRCRVEYKSTTQDPDYGTPVITWTLLAVVWCNWQDVLPSRAETTANGLEQQNKPARVRMRYRTDVDGTMRLIVHRPGVQIYEITSGPAILGDKDGIEMMAQMFSTQGS